MKFFSCLLAAGFLLAAAGCWTLTVRHKIDPIYITMDVNVKAEKQLNEFFDFEDQRDSSGTPANTTRKKIEKEK